MTTLIEAAVIGYLAEALHTSAVYAERPVNPSGDYYVVERTSGGETNHIKTATIAVQSVSDTSMLQAAQMSNAVTRAMPGIVQLGNVSCCRLNSEYNYTDTETRQYRYQAVFDLYYTEGE